MKYIIIILLFFCVGCKGQSFVVNGVTYANGLAWLNHIDSVQVAKSAKAYQTLQGVSVGSTLTPAQLQTIAWIELWNMDAINPITGKTDSLRGYIK